MAGKYIRDDSQIIHSAKVSRSAAILRGLYDQQAMCVKRRFHRLRSLNRRLHRLEHP
jgi:hypothetical protein